MEITLFENHDVKDLYELWRQTFGDSDSTIDLFFKESFKSKNTVVCYDGERLVAMLYLLPEQLYIKEKEYPACYIYAAATHPDYRRQGIMGKLLTFTDEICKSRSILFEFLVPANEHLFDYYKKFGFVKGIRKKVLTLPYEIVEKFAESKMEMSFNFDFNNYNIVKDKVLKGKSYVKWQDSEIRLFSEYLKQSGGELLISDIGYTAFEKDGNSLKVYEFCACSDNIVKFLNVFLKYSDIENFNLDLPVNFQLISDNQVIEDVGMIKSLSDVKVDDESVYIGFTLN